ncbi:DHH family phosphoesterase [Streptomyces sp. NPDC127106]|uniref:DHH family phosphoesterase n=1 Tax=Streptomyces sp. NPDC127106 TaxID=3345360 RepID=UPI0036341765
MVGSVPEGERVDIDGTSSGVLGYAGLSELGFDVERHLPDDRRGHELAPEDVAEIHAKWPDTRALLTCYAGDSPRGVAAARAPGWTTLLTDHHEELAPGSTADTTVDPCRIDETYAHTGVCGAHVLYQVIGAYTRVHRPEKLWEIRLLRLFAGLGTVSDVMPVLYENRRLVRDAISIARLLRVATPKTIPHPWGGFDSDPDATDIEQSIRMQPLRTEPHHPVCYRGFEGFAIVLKTFARVGRIRDVDDRDEGFFGFGRTHRRGPASGPAGVPLGRPPGMYGLLANRMMGFNGHPVVVVNRPADPDDFVSGSGRAPRWFDIITSLEQHDGLSAIGHQRARVLRVAKAEKLGHLVAVLQETARVALLAVSTDGPKGDLVLGPDADCDAGPQDLRPLFELVRRTEGLKPFGHGFTTPVVEIETDHHGRLSPYRRRP